MPKISKGRLDGVWGMRNFSAEDLYALASKIEAQLGDPQNTDDPKWLQRRANRVRALAKKKEDALAHKNNQKES